MATAPENKSDPAFLQFVLMHAQNVALFLGQIPHPSTGKPEINLEMATLFIDQLASIKKKTTGNLTAEEEELFQSTLTSLQLSFVEASKTSRAEPTPGATPPANPTPEQPSAQQPAAQKPTAQSTDKESPADSGDNSGKKKFTKSYGSL